MTTLLIIGLQSLKVNDSVENLIDSLAISVDFGA